MKNMFRTIFEESTDIFNEKNSTAIADYVMERHGKEFAYFQDVHLLHMDNVAIKSLSFDRESGRTLISHDFDLLEIQGLMTFVFPEHHQYPFVLELHHGTLNGSHLVQYPHYNVSMKSELMRATGDGSMDRFLGILKAYAEEYVVNAVLFGKVAESFRTGFARLLNEELRTALTFIPNDLGEKDRLTAKCSSNTSLISFIHVDFSQLKDQLNNKSVKYVDFENRVDHFVTGFRIDFGEVHLTSDMTVRFVNGFSQAATKVHLDVDRIDINIRYDSKHSPRYQFNVNIDGLHFKTNNQFNKDVKNEISDRLPLCIGKCIAKTIERSIHIREKHGLPEVETTTDPTDLFSL
jgi:hypothetical protein